MALPITDLLNPFPQSAKITAVKMHITRVISFIIQNHNTEIFSDVRNDDSILTKFINVKETVYLQSGICKTIIKEFTSTYTSTKRQKILTVLVFFQSLLVFLG